jgi:hypothetical protein
MLPPKAPKRALNSESDDFSPSTKRQKKATRKGARVLPSNGRDFKRRTKEGKAILISSSSEDEAPVSAQPKSPTPVTLTHISDSDTDASSLHDERSPQRPSPVTLTHISDSDTDASSLHGQRSPQRKSRAERLAKVYDQGNPNFDETDLEIEHDKTTESSPGSGKKNHRSYPIRYLAARQEELEDELGKIKQEIEQGKARELELTGQQAETRESIEVLSNLAAISSEI